jgi:hypothetical protein
MLWERAMRANRGRGLGAPARSHRVLPNRCHRFVTFEMSRQGGDPLQLGNRP